MKRNKIKQDFKFLGKNFYFSALLIFFLFLNSLDWTYTYYGVENRGFKEGNILFDNCINSGDYLPVLTAKTSFSFLLVLSIFFIFKYYSRIFGYFLISAVNLYYLIIVIRWIILLS